MSPKKLSWAKAKGLEGADGTGSSLVYFSGIFILKNVGICRDLVFT
jgi:hypothetical protein